jgi:hypothetical protein
LKIILNYINKGEFIIDGGGGGMGEKLGDLNFPDEKRGTAILLNQILGGGAEIEGRQISYNFQKS